MNDACPPSRRQKFRLALECFGLFVVAPAGGAAAHLPVAVIPMLLLMALGCGLVLRFHYHMAWREFVCPPVPAREWWRVLAIYAIALPCLLGFLWLLEPGALFSLVRKHPGLWLLLMAGYPLLSVIPQELIYRAFFFRRYRGLFGEGSGLVLAGAALFGLGHVLFHNWPSVLLSFLGGCLFGITYQRTSSLLVASVEHALYGCAVFTLGYGAFFFDDTMRAFR
jgi:membrane protease YdiL (CAAX protease family)